VRISCDELESRQTYKLAFFSIPTKLFKHTSQVKVLEKQLFSS